MGNFEEFYNRNYKKIMLIPLIIFILSLIVIGVYYSKNGDIFNKDVSLKGGVSATIYGDFDSKLLEQKLNEKYSNANILMRELSDIGSEKLKGVIIEVSIAPEQSDELKKFLEEQIGFELNSDNYSSESVGSSLGESFYKQMIIALIFAFIFMAIVVFFVFRSFVPSMNVVLCAICDITTTIAVMDLINLRVSTAGISALLLIMGYSVDTDILMTSKTVKRKVGTVFSRLKSSFYTGITMTGTTIVALLVGYFVTNSIVIKEMFLILLIAMFADIFYTYLMNAGILRWYLKHEN